MVHSRSVRACRWLAQAGLPFWPASRLFFSVTFVSGIASEVRLVSPVHFVSDGDLREILAKVFRRVVLRIPAEWALDFSPIGSPIHGGGGDCPTLPGAQALLCVPHRGTVRPRHHQRWAAPRVECPSANSDARLAVRISGAISKISPLAPSSDPHTPRFVRRLRAETTVETHGSRARKSPPGR